MAFGKRVIGFGALAMACAPVVASATVLFEDNFDVDTSGRYDQFVFDRAVAPDAATKDARAQFAYNYGGYQHWSTNINGDFVPGPIPSAPRSTGGTTSGLRLDVNDKNEGVSPNCVTISLYPKLNEYLGGTLPSGDHKLTVDVWMNYNGDVTGDGGSTEHFNIGINQQGGGVGGGVQHDAQGVPFQMPAGGPYDGLAWTVNGERGNAFDYRYYRGNFRLGGPDALDLEVGQIPQDMGPNLPGPADGRNVDYQNWFPFLNPNDENDVWYETPGAIGKHWTTAEMVYEDGIVYHYLKPEGSTAAPFLIAARTEESIVSGHAMLGYADFNNGIAELEDGNGQMAEGVDANFVVFDNLVVETIQQTRQKWNSTGGGNWSEAGKWDNGEPNAVTHVADFTTALAAPAVVNVDAPRTVRSIVFDSATNGYTIDGTNAITIDSLTTGIFGTLKSRAGSHTISAPVVLKRPAIFDVAAGSQLALTNIDAGGFRLVKNGAGTATVNHLRTPRLNVNAGTMRVAPSGGAAASVSVVPQLVLADGARLDLSDNKLITATPAGTATGGVYAAGSVHRMVQTAYQESSWSGPGLTTSMEDATTGLTTIAIATGEQIGVSTFGGQSIAPTDTIAFYTYGGDTNFDGKLDADDYGTIDFNVLLPGPIDGYYNGDFNYDGVVNADDYGVIDFNILAQTTPFPTGGDAGSSAGLAGVAAVPEPASLSVLGLAAASLLGRRRRRG